MTVSLPPASSTTPLPFYNPANGTFRLPPLVGDRRISTTTDGVAFDAPFQPSHRRQTSTSSQTTRSNSPSRSPPVPAMSQLSLSSRPPSPPASPPRVPHGTRPGSSHRRRSSISSNASTPAFKLIPQPMLDPSKRPLRPTDALVVFPSAAGISQASQKKAKLLVGKDILTFFELQQRQALSAPGAPPPKAYAYKMVWEQKWSQAAIDAFMSRRGSSIDAMDLETPPTS
ncbi:hypothetical protein FRB99_004971 [Tulasnella sp. 403]|nr:hypothetical protein FRB99_004971 [Tulasnella sp. 403]